MNMSCVTGEQSFIKHQQCFKNKLPLLFVSFWVFFFLKNGTCHGSDLDGCLEAFNVLHTKHCIFQKVVYFREPFLPF
jgi:hypothetical protein